MFSSHMYFVGRTRGFMIVDGKFNIVQLTLDLITWMLLNNIRCEIRRDRSPMNTFSL